MCEQCELKKEIQFDAEAALVEEFLTHYRPMFEHHKFEVLVPALLQLVRERVEEQAKKNSPVPDAEWNGCTARILLPELVGCTVSFDQLITTPEGRIVAAGRARYEAMQEKERASIQ